MNSFGSLAPHLTSCSLWIKEKKVWSRTALRGKEVFSFSLTMNPPRRKINTSAHLSPWPPHTFLLTCWALKRSNRNHHPSIIRNLSIRVTRLDLQILKKQPAPKMKIPLWVPQKRLKDWTPEERQQDNRPKTSKEEEEEDDSSRFHEENPNKDLKPESKIGVES